jgi:hypothetical protein
VWAKRGPDRTQQVGLGRLRQVQGGSLELQESHVNGLNQDVIN